MNSKDYLSRIAKHVHILNEEVGKIKQDVTVLRNDVSWIKKLLVPAIASSTAAAAALIGILVKILLL